MSTLTVSVILMYLVAVGSLGFGFRYAFASKIMSYHERAIGTKYEELDSGVAKLLVMLTRVAGVSFVALAVCLAALVTWPYRAGEQWAWWTAWIASLISVVPITILARRLTRYTPWQATLGLSAVVVVAAVLALVS